MNRMNNIDNKNAVRVVPPVSDVLNIDLNYEYALKSANGAGDVWCGERIQAKASFLASMMQYEYGLAKEADNTIKYWYNCNIANKSSKDAYYQTNVIQLSADEIRDRYTCQEIKSALDVALNAWEDATEDQVMNDTFIGGAANKDRKIQTEKWRIIKNQLQIADIWTDPDPVTGEPSCPVQELQEAGDAVTDYLAGLLNQRPAGISSGTLAAIIGAGVISMILVINKVVK